MSEQPGRVEIRTVADVMNRAVVCAYEGALFKEVALALERNHVEAVPVIDQDRRVVGVITASDLLARVAEARPAPRGHRLTARSELREKLHAATARELMTAPAITTLAHATLREAAHLTARARVRSLPVVDDDGVLLGMVSRADLVRQFLRTDDDIRDEIERVVVDVGVRPGRGQVEVLVDEGVVTLRGTVAGVVLAEALIYGARRVTGVVEVRDEIRIDVDDRILPIST